MPSADELLELAEARRNSETAPAFDYEMDEDDDGYEPIADTVNGATETVRVVSELQSHLLPDGNVEFGTACVVINSKHFGDKLYFLVITGLQNGDIDPIRLGALQGSVKDATFYQNYWSLTNPDQRVGARFVPS